jgi:hypothetical protein
MTAAAERAVHRDVAGSGSKAAKDFLHHDRPMCARRRLAGREDLLHLRGVPLGVQFFVFVVKPARVPAWVSRAPRMRRGCVRRRTLHHRSHRVQRSAQRSRKPSAIAKESFQFTAQKSCCHGCLDSVGLTASVHQRRVRPHTLCHQSIVSIRVPRYRIDSGL